MSEKKILVGGFGNYCCVPGCKSSFRDKREDLRKKWLNVLKHVHRKGGTGSFDVKNPNKRICVCEFRFKDEDLTTILGRRKNKVRLGEFLQYSESNK